MYQHLYQKFLEGHAGKIHLAAHSHYFWPDVSLDGHTQYWMDASRFSDKKWNIILGEKLIAAQNHIAKILNLKNPQNIAFAPNTHELLTRLLSCLMDKKELNILTTDSEFHSFSRQIKRLDEFSHVNVTYLRSEDENFEQQLLSIAQDLNQNYDLIFLSHVFFNSGKFIDLKVVEEVARAKAENTLLVLDGYHGFCALPTDLSALENKIFYLSGGYKYAQAGEGMCFMTIPENCQLRPVYTGWFASFSTLEDEASELIQYDNNGWRFWGSTQDLSSLYRFLSVWDQFDEMSVDTKKINHYIKELQSYFITKFKARVNLLSARPDQLGHFLTLKFSSHHNAQKAHQFLLSNNILTDFRGDRLRFGFGIYLTQIELDKALEVLNSQDFLKLVI